MRRYVGYLVVGLLLAGCAKKPERADVQEVFLKADTLIQAGDTNAAINVLSETLADKAYRRDRARVFSSLLNMLLLADRIGEAQDRYLKAVEEDKDLAWAGFGIVYNYYRARSDTDALIQWTKKLVEAPLPKSLAEQAFAKHIEAYRTSGQFDRVLELAPVCVKRFHDAASCKIIRRLIQSVFATKKYADGERLLDVLEKLRRKGRKVRALVTVSRTDLLTLQERWQDAEQQFLETAAGLSDADLAGSLARVASRAISNQKLELLDKLCVFVLESQKRKDNARCEAARQWIKVARTREDVAAVPSRLESLMQLGIPSKVLLSLYDKEFYVVMNKGKKENLANMVSFGDKLITVLENEDDKTEVRMLALDGTFVIKDYARSLKILEQGIPEKEKEWHEMAVNKVKAHLALKEGKKKEAVERFRKFMDHVSTWEEPEQDPSTGMFHTKEMCLGRNAKRIGDILGSMGEKKASREAYKEARNYYEKALGEIRPESEEYPLVQAEMAEIPAQK